MPPRFSAALLFQPPLPSVETTASWLKDAIRSVQTRLPKVSVAVTLFQVARTALLCESLFDFFSLNLYTFGVRSPQGGHHHANEHHGHHQPILGRVRVYQ
jgi:hypothetical protein